MKRFQPWLDTFSLLSGQPVTRCDKPGEQFLTLTSVKENSRANPEFPPGQPARGTSRLKRMARLIAR